MTANFRELEISMSRGMDETQPMRSRAVAAGVCVMSLRFMGLSWERRVLHQFYARQPRPAKRGTPEMPFRVRLCGADATKTPGIPSAAPCHRRIRITAGRGAGAS